MKISQCIFCKSDSSNSKSIEHILPASLGNSQHVLNPGIVCDSCNNYLSRKVEKPILDSLYFKESRFQASIPSRRGRIPALDGIHLQSVTHIELTKDVEWGFWFDERGDLFFVLILFGEEYALNLCRRSVVGYDAWLQSEPIKSPLYPTGVSRISDSTA